MIANQTRRTFMSGGAASFAGAVLPTPADANPTWAALARRLTLAAGARQVARRKYQSGRDAMARWRDQNPAPECVGDGTAVLAWLDAYRAAIDAKGVRGNHAAYVAASGEHEAAARAAAAGAVNTWEDLQALGRLASLDYGNIIRDALHARVMERRGLA